MSSTGSNSCESDICTSDEWTVVTHLEGDGPERQPVVSVRRESKSTEEITNTAQVSDAEKEDEVREQVSRSDSTVSSDWVPVKGGKSEEDALSSDSSDIAVLGDGEDEDDESVKKPLKEKTPPPPEDALGLSRVEELRDDMSDISSVRDEINSEVDFSPSPFRHYVHVPNSRVNLTLTVVAVLAVTAVLGLGVGNFIGWSCMQRVIMPSVPVQPQQQQQRRHDKYHDKYQNPKMDERVRTERDLLKQMHYLHRQLSMCNKQPHNKVCLKEGENWRRQFADLIASEGGDKLLKELQIDKTQPETNTGGVNLQQQQQQLQDLENKLSMLTKQIETLQAQKNQDEKQNRNPNVINENRRQVETPKESGQKVDNNLYVALNEQVQLLKQQNQELHTMLQSLQTRDTVKTQNKPELLKLREEVAQAVLENNKLKAMMDNIKTNQETDVRQQINDLKMENQDLRVEIGRLRYSQAKQQDPKPESEKMKESRTEEDDSNESNKGLFSKWPEVNWTDLVNQLGSTSQGKRLEELGEALSQLLRDISELNATLFPPGEEQSTQEEEEREDSLKEIENLLVSKWRELQGIVSLSKGYVSRHAEGMSRLLAASMSKVYKTGVKVLFGDPHKPSPTISSVQPQLQKIMSKMGKVMTSLEEKWSKMKKRMNDDHVQFDKAEDMDDKLDDNMDDSEEDMDSSPQWMFQRAKDREQSKETPDSKFYEDWYLLRSKNRKRQRQEQEKQASCKDPKKCKKMYKKQNVKVVDDSSDEGWGGELPKHMFKDSRGY